MPLLIRSNCSIPLCIVNLFNDGYKTNKHIIQLQQVLLTKDVYLQQWMLINDNSLDCIVFVHKSISIICSTPTHKYPRWHNIFEKRFFNCTVLNVPGTYYYFTRKKFFWTNTFTGRPSSSVSCVGFISLPFIIILL